MASESKRRELTIAKRVEIFGHVASAEMEEIMAGTGMDPKRIADACRQVYDACDLCAMTGRPIPNRKISTRHVNEAFDMEVQADFTYVRIHRERCELLNIVDIGTRYGERSLTASRAA